MNALNHTESLPDIFGEIFGSLLPKQETLEMDALVRRVRDPKHELSVAEIDAQIPSVIYWNHPGEELSIGDANDRIREAFRWGRKVGINIASKANE